MHLDLAKNERVLFFYSLLFCWKRSKGVNFDFISCAGPLPCRLGRVGQLEGHRLLFLAASPSAPPGSQQGLWASAVKDKGSGHCESAHNRLASFIKAILAASDKNLPQAGLSNRTGNV